MDIDWVCMKCGGAHQTISVINDRDKCFRCGWKRPKENQERRITYSKGSQLGNDSDTIYKYKKISMVNEEEFDDNRDNYRYIIKKLKDKINEVVVEYNHLAKDLELYKAAYKQHMVDYH